MMTRTDGTAASKSNIRRTDWKGSVMKTRSLPLTFVAIALAAVAAPAGEKGLVAHYGFEKGRWPTVVDMSGNGNNGRIIGGVKRIKGEYGSALDFNGKDGYVNCGKGRSLNIASAGTVMVWARAGTPQGGLVCWSLDHTYPGARLLLTVDTYHGGANTIGCVSDGKKADGYRGFGSLPKGKWTHLAYTFDGKTISTYRDGLPTATNQQRILPLIKGVDLWIGRCLGFGQQYFHGALDEVRIYSRVLTADEILAYYKKEAPARGKDMSVFRRVVLDARAYRGPGKIIATLDAQAMHPLPAGTVIRVDLCHEGAQKPIRRLETREIPRTDTSDVTFDAQHLARGSYAVIAAVIGPDGRQIGDTSSVPLEWQDRLPEFKGIKILNNLCWELANVRYGIGEKLTFDLPCDRWVFVRSDAQVGDDGEIRVGIDAGPRDTAVIVHSKDSARLIETMRYLKAGRHSIHISRKGKTRLKHLVVRAIPALQHAFYGGDPQIEPFGPYDWDFLKKDVLPNINVMLAGLDHYRRPDAFERLKEWKKMGRSWIAYKALPWDKKSADEVFEYWSNTAGFQHPLVDGLIIDEANGGDLKIYDYLREAVERMHAHPKFKGKAVNPYCDALYGMDRSTKFARTCLKGGGYLCWERYFNEELTQKELRSVMRRYMVGPMSKWEEVFPGCTKRMVMVLGYMSEPPENLSLYPSVDYKVCMDTQVRMLATHPAFFGLGGLQEYHCGYAGEETVRWAGRLYRHYAIEGNTEPLTEDPYRLAHIQNPDFTEGTAGWTIETASKDSVRAMKHEDYGTLIQGRFPGGIGDRNVRPMGVGDTFLRMKRTAERPNAFSQQIRNLTPGRAYSMKMITADYQDLLQGRSNSGAHAISIKLDNAEVLPGPKNSFQFPVRQARKVGKFTYKHRFGLNYHWRTFRAKGTSAELTVTDWKSDKDPGGPIGQELMFNFIEVQPYLEP